jgi:hypothetical protein
VDSRNYLMALIALVGVGVGIWWAMPDTVSRQSKDTRAITNSTSPNRATDSASAGASSALPSPSPATPVVVNSISSNAETAPPASAPPPHWDFLAKRFAARPDPDPLLSRKLESAIQEFAKLGLDPNRFEVPSIICRGEMCQIISVDRTPGLENGWLGTFGKIFPHFQNAPVSNPNTGAELGAPWLERVEQLPAGAWDTVVGFGKPPR